MLRRAVATSVSYTHLDVYKRQDLGVDLGVTGVTAMGIDVSEKMGDVLPIYLAVVLGLSLLVLLLV